MNRNELMTGMEQRRAEMRALEAEINAAQRQLSDKQKELSEYWGIGRIEVGLAEYRSGLVGVP